MNFEFYLNEHIKKHPSVMPQDIVKLCYQAAMGAEHLLRDEGAARRYFFGEFEAVEARDGELYESISDGVCRVDLGVWKLRGLQPEALFSIFVESARACRGDRERLEEYLSIAEKAMPYHNVGFTPDEWQDFIAKYRSAGCPAVHHSENYRKCEMPSYRIVNSELVSAIKVLEALAKSKNNDSDKAFVIAIDGRAASGKSTLAGRLSSLIGADVIHMDDFFLPIELRCKERLCEAGGNIHYERFSEEVLPFVSSRNPFEYGAFDCGQMRICSKRSVGAGSIRIVEGSYSHHPNFKDYADLRVFCTVSPDEQMRRILERNGERWAEIFKEKWIPMEEKYFAAFSLESKADLVV